MFEFNTPKIEFEDVLSKCTCSPISINDFRNFLIYEQHSEENLNFYLWYLDYCKRFETLKKDEKEILLKYMD